MNRKQSLAFRRPFSSVWQAATMLDCTERQIYHYVQEGRLPLAFDICRPGADRVCIRMATASVVSLQRVRLPSADLAPFLERVAPETQFSFKAPQLARLLQCDLDHIYRLVSTHVLEDVGGPTRYRLPRESVIRFLKERRIK
jgi:hypothetical protein